MKSFNDIDFSKFKLPIVSVYEKPLDYPDKYVARMYDMEKPTHYIAIADTLEELRKEKPYFMVILAPDEKDEKHIVETWV